MPCPPLVPISIIPPVSQGVAPILWQNGSQITRLNIPLNPSFLVYDGTITRWGDGSAQAPVYLPNIQEVNGPALTYLAGITSTGQLVKTLGVSGTALIGGAAGAVVYQTGTSTTGFTAVGTTGQSLLSGGTGTPTWGTPASATTATNIASGVAGAVPYQSGVGATAFTAAGTTGQVLISNGTSAPTWSTNISGQAGSVANGSVTTAKLSTGGPSWDTSGNLTATGNFTANTVTSTNSLYAGFVSQVASNNLPYFQIYNSAGPTDKKYIRTTLATNGVFGLERVDDAYSTATYILSANANNVINTNGNPITNCLTTAKAWVNFNGTTATPSTIRSSYNVSSITRNGTGDYTINFATAMADANYTVTALATSEANLQITNLYIQSLLTTGAQILSLNSQNGTLLANKAIICVQVFGN